jgi:hypothetical protein
MNQYHDTQYDNFTDKSAGRAVGAQKYPPLDNPTRNCRTPWHPVRISVRVTLGDLGVDGRIILK